MHPILKNIWIQNARHPGKLSQIFPKILVSQTDFRNTHPIFGVYGWVYQKSIRLFIFLFSKFSGLFPRNHFVSCPKILKSAIGWVFQKLVLARKFSNKFTCDIPLGGCVTRIALEIRSNSSCWCSGCGGLGCCLVIIVECFHEWFFEKTLCWLLVIRIYHSVR